MIVAEDNTAIIMTETTLKIVFFIYPSLVVQSIKILSNSKISKRLLLGRVSVDRKVSNEASGPVAFQDFELEHMMSRLEIVSEHVKPWDMQSFAPRGERVEQGIFLPIDSVGQDSGVWTAGAI